jgi:hypothetical protein
MIEKTWIGISPLGSTGERVPGQKMIRADALTRS